MQDDFTRRYAPYQAGEKETLEGFLDYQRATLLLKTGGLSEEELRRPMVPSGTSLLGLVKHLAYVERSWFQITFLGEELDVPWSEEDPDADFRIEDGESYGSVVAFYRRQIERSREIVRGASLDDIARRSGRDPSLRWIMTHMIEETARHNGHADILRELIDGSIGE